MNMKNNKLPISVNPTKIIIKSDKTSNHYLFFIADEYHKAICNEVNKTSKKAPAECENNINNQTKIITRKLKTDDRVQHLHKQLASMIVKGHKNKFPNNPQFQRYFYGYNIQRRRVFIRVFSVFE